MWFSPFRLTPCGKQWKEIESIFGNAAKSLEPFELLCNYKKREDLREVVGPRIGATTPS